MCSVVPHKRNDAIVGFSSTRRNTAPNSPEGAAAANAMSTLLKHHTINLVDHKGKPETCSSKVLLSSSTNFGSMRSVSASNPAER